MPRGRPSRLATRLLEFLYLRFGEDEVTAVHFDESTALGIVVTK